jgi:nucleotide-binding universal stress UspA family protein
MQVVRTSTAISFKNVLFLTDFSEASNRALAYALAVARHFQARIYPAHVIDHAPAESAASNEPIADMEARKRQQLARQVEYNGLRFYPLLSRCDLESAIPHWIAEYGIDLIVMGTHGRRGIQRFLLGSTSEWVVRNALCPVLTVGPHVNVPRLFSLAIDKVIYTAGLSGQDHAISLKYALSLAEERSARLTLLHILPEESRDYHDRTRVLRFTLDQLQSMLPADATSRCRPDLAVDAGDPGERILHHAESEQPDLIVMGLARTHESKNGTAPGVTYRVISSAPCAVLTVPEAARD